MIVACLIAGVTLAVPLTTFADVSFIIVDQGEKNTEAARQLHTHLRNNNVDLAAPQALEYKAVIEKLAGWDKSEGYSAHMTPYACVVAEMLGADFEVIATTHGESTNGSTTYNSYFVVSKDQYPSEGGLEQLPAYLKSFDSAKPRFIYHSKFSTSSFLSW